MISIIFTKSFRAVRFFHLAIFWSSRSFYQTFFFCEQNKTLIVKLLNYFLEFFLFYSNFFEMFRQKKTFSKKNFFSKLKNIQKKLKRMFNAFLQSAVSIALISKIQKNLTTKKTFFEKMFQLLFEKLKCKIRSKIIKKCKLSSLSFSISNIFIWRIDDLYCDILANESRFIQKFEICQTNNFVRLMMFQNENFCWLTNMIIFVNCFRFYLQMSSKSQSNESSNSINISIKKWQIWNEITRFFCSH